MKLEDRSEFLPGVLLFICGTIALILNLGLEPLHFEEPRRAIVALEMLLSDNWWVPKINGEFYYNKPPVYNWLLIILFNVFGYQAWVARLPSLLSLLTIGIINYHYFKTHFGAPKALWASLFFITSGDILFYFSFQGEIDLFYTLIVYLQILAAIHFWLKGSYWLLFLISYLLCAVGFLTKGLPSLAFQALTLLGLFLIKGRFKSLFHPAHFAGIILLFAVIGGFFVTYSQYNDPTPYLLRLVSESTRRTAVGESSFLSTVSHLWQFPIMLLTIASPWWGLSLWHRHQLRFSALRQNPLVESMLIFIGCNILLYWLSPGTRERYLYMFLPFMFNILAFSLSEEKLTTKSLRWTLAAIGIVAGLAALSIPFIEKLSIVAQWPVAFGLFVSCLSITYLIIKGGPPILWFACLLFILRIGFDLTVLPVRANKADALIFRSSAEEILNKTGNEPISLELSKKTVYHPIPFSSDSIAYEEVHWPPYQFSYYISTHNGHILGENPYAGWVIREVSADTFGDDVIRFPSKGQYYQLKRR